MKNETTQEKVKKINHRSTLTTLALSSSYEISREERERKKKKRTKQQHQEEHKTKQKTDYYSFITIYYVKIIPSFCF